MAMRNIFGKGNGDTPTPGRVDLQQVMPGMSLLVANRADPPPADLLPIAIAEVLQRWLLETGVRVRETLPVIKDGNMIGLFVWWDSPPPGFSPTAASP
jgi:hypothetical protein